jgi:hypothetical protein
MKKSSFIIPVMLTLVFIYSFKTLTEENSAPQGPTSSHVVVAFVTYNDHGNNLYIDNLALGSRPAVSDLAITAIDNIPPGTYITPGSSPVKIFPKIHITNIGSTQSTDTIYACLRITSLAYFDSILIESPVPAGTDTVIQFDSIMVSAGTGLDLFTYLQASGDTLQYNDSLYQWTYFQEGVKRNVLFQEFTSATSFGCAINNVGMNNFINNNFDSIVAIKYPWGVPSPNDSMYLASKIQMDSIVSYFNAAFVPLSYADGNTFISLPYNTDSLLNAPYQTRRNIGSPISISVSDSVSGNTITSKIDINVLSQLPPGNYRLKPNVLQRVVAFDTIPTNWYDSTFYDVFRKAIPGIHGVPIQTSAGTQSFTFTYNIQAGWNASQIFTAAFVENEETREVLNSAKGGNFTPVTLPPASRLNTDQMQVDPHYPYRQNGFNVLISTPHSNPNVNWNGQDVLPPQYKYFVELFEGYYPPPGWTISNPDALFTFQRFTGVNGPSFTGVNCIQMPFYNYDTINAYRRDTLKSKIYYELRDSNIITFNYAYAPYSNTFRDSLKVLISVDGGETYPFEVFNKGGNSLATAPATSTGFAPINASQWKTDTIHLGGIVSVNPISSAIPGNFVLNQNYPNPFNPVTKIIFSIPNKSYASLKVYDVTGREIRSYINSNIQAGTYSVDFDGNGLSSGVYFYRLTAGDFIQTRKMVLVK